METLVYAMIGLFALMQISLCFLVWVLSKTDKEKLKEITRFMDAYLKNSTPIFSLFRAFLKQFLNDRE